MHELSIAATIVEDVLAFCKSHAPSRIVRVRLAISELTCVQPEQLKFCYHSVSHDTPLADSELDIETVPARVRCSYCGYQGAPKYWLESLADTPIPTLQCPNCARSAEPAEGHECSIKTIQYAP